MSHKKKTVFLGVMIFVSFFSRSVFAEVLARVNERQIHDHEIKVRVQSYLRQIGHKRLSPLRMASLEKTFLKKLIEEELLYQAGLNLKLSISEQEISLGLEKIRQRFTSQDAYDDALSKEALSFEDLEAGVSRSILIQKTWQRLSQLNEVARANRVREMTQAADIHIFETQVARVDESE